MHSGRVGLRRVGSSRCIITAAVEEFRISMDPTIREDGCCVALEHSAFEGRQIEPLEPVWIREDVHLTTFPFAIVKPTTENTCPSCKRDTTPMLPFIRTT